MPAGVERYQVDGGGAILVQLHAGDRVNVRNLEGGQTAERLTIGGDGRCDARALGTPCNAQGDGVRAVLTSGNTSLQRVRRKLDQLGAKLANAPSLRLFDSATHPGAPEDVTANHTAYRLVTAPGHDHNGLTQSEREELKALQREKRERKQANEILRKGETFGRLHL